MDEQQMNEGLLCDADRKLIASAARLQKYVEAPVPAGLLGELSDDLLKLAFIPYASRSKLSSLYGPGLDFMSLVSADWREAFSQGALRMHNAKTISFPTHIEMANGEAVELSISENAQEGGPAWFLSYVPIVEHMKLRRDCVAEAKAESEKPRLPKEPLPALMEDGFAGMQESEDYLVNPVPLAVLNELDSMDAEFSSFVWVSQRRNEQIAEYEQRNIDVLELLNRDWDYALSNRVLRYYEGKVIFPVSIVRDDGETLVEVSIKRDRGAERPGALPWHVCFVDNFARQKVRAGHALFDWAYLGNFDDTIESLAEMALAEKWGSKPTTSRSRIRFSKAISRIPSIGCRLRAKCSKTAKGESPHSIRASSTQRMRRFMRASPRRTWSSLGASRRSVKRVRECGERSSWLRLSLCRKGRRMSKRKMTCFLTGVERFSAMSTTFFSTTSTDCRRRFSPKSFVAQMMR